MQTFEIVTRKLQWYNMEEWLSYSDITWLQFVLRVKVVNSAVLHYCYNTFFGIAINIVIPSTFILKYCMLYCSSF